MLRMSPPNSLYSSSASPVFPSAILSPKMPVALSEGLSTANTRPGKSVSEDMYTVVVRAPPPTITSDCLILSVP